MDSEHRSKRKRRRAKSVKNRPPWLLRRCAVFCRNFGWWPSAVELAAYTQCGSRIMAWRDLATLRSVGLVENVERCRWRVTDAGFGFLSLPVVVARKLPPKRKMPARSKREKAAEKLRRQVDAHRALDSVEIVD